MDNNVRKLYLCYLTTEKGARVGIIYGFLQRPEGRDYFDTYSTQDDTIKKFLDGLRYMVQDEKVL